MTVATTAGRQSLNWAITTPAAGILLAAAASPPPPAGAGGKEEEEDLSLYCRKKALLLPLTTSPKPSTSIRPPGWITSWHITGILLTIIIITTFLPSSLLLLLILTPQRIAAPYTCYDPALNSLHAHSEMSCLLGCMPSEFLLLTHLLLTKTFLSCFCTI